MGFAHALKRSVKNNFGFFSVFVDGMHINLVESIGDVNFIASVTGFVMFNKKKNLGSNLSCRHMLLFISFEATIEWA